jgi:hypothetical protein
MHVARLSNVTLLDGGEWRDAPPYSRHQTYLKGVELAARTLRLAEP